jgi:hypothetical protein
MAKPKTELELLVAKLIECYVEYQSREAVIKTTGFVMGDNGRLWSIRLMQIDPEDN